MVEAAIPEDLAAIGEIYAHYVQHSVATFELTAPDDAEWKQRFASVTEAGLPFLVARVHGEVAGYAYCSPWKARPAYRYTVEDSIYLAPAAAGRGVGGRLLDELLARCADAGIREVIAVIADPGPQNPSPFLHRRRGFTDAGRLTGVGFKHGRRLDTLLMQKTLS
ncbi:N-acetyltransferase family protein [Amycolatopsis alkalitolerans]|uniref:N-acetyltransferase family protein n=2 Tax=Amycolatopsis alkalitolerans TaxID=2547244 RepID=A0A5C4M0X0_9PSEU|nr:N-acetyltransferase family protein [Amycolatopsis alkalitolerans]